MKRLSALDPLTPDDVAERLDRSALRTLKIMMEVRQDADLFGQVQRSRYLTNVVELLADEAKRWADARTAETDGPAGGQ